MGDIYDSMERRSSQFYSTVNWEATLRGWLEDSVPFPDECEYCGFSDFTEPKLSHSTQGITNETAVAHARCTCLMCNTSYTAAKVLSKEDFVRDE